MCRQVTCRTCGKKTWAGCGRHIDQAMSGVPSTDRCPGHAKDRRAGLFARLFGR